MSKFIEISDIDGNAHSINIEKIFTIKMCTTTTYRITLVDFGKEIDYIDIKEVMYNDIVRRLRSLNYMLTWFSYLLIIIKF